MTQATYSVQVSWSGRLTGVFTIGTSPIGGTDVIGGTFGNYEYDTLTDDVKRIEIRRGRASDFGAMQQGSCTLRLSDSTGKYNPENPSSPLVGYLVPMRPVRITATYDGTAYGLFHGFIASIEHDPDPETQETVIYAVDLFEWLNAHKPVIATQTSKTIDYLIGQILDAIGWTDPAARSLEASLDTVPSWSADGSSTALSLITTLLQTDMGAFLIDGNGKAVYRNRGIRYGQGSVVDTFTAAHMRRIRASVSKDDIVNSQTVTRTGGTAQTVTDAESRRMYGYRDGAAISSAYLGSDSQANSLAQFLVLLQKDPRVPARSLDLINGDATRLVKQLAREIGDLVAVNESVGGSFFTGRIQGLSHDISDGFTVHRTTFSVQKTNLQAFTIGMGTIGGPHVLAY